MDIVLLIIGLVLLLGGIIGSFLPVLPGPITAWFGLLVLHLTTVIPMNYWLLGVTLAIAILIFVLDYFIPSIGTKRFGGSRYGVIGTTVGLLLGIFFFPPLGIVVGPFLGALIGELIYGATTEKAIKAAFGSLLGLLTSSLLKFSVSCVFSGIFIWKAIANASAFIG